MGPRTTLPLAALAAAALLMVSPLAGAATPGNPVRGKTLFGRAAQLFCGSCHTLKTAGSTGRDGPNLDKAKPSFPRIVDFVTNGRNPTRRWPTGMPGYGGRQPRITKAEIQDIAAFVYNATHR
jgi:mono/diheme cytochrome c family protein